MRLTLSQWVRWRVSSMNAPKEYSLLLAAQKLKKDTRIHRWVCLPHWNQHGKDGRHRAVFISLGNLIYSYRWEQTFRERLLCARPWVRCQGRATGEPLHILTVAIWMADGREHLVWEDPWLHPGEGWTTPPGRDIWVVSWRVRRKWDDSKTAPDEGALGPRCALWESREVWWGLNAKLSREHPAPASQERGHSLMPRSMQLADIFFLSFWPM